MEVLHLLLLTLAATLLGTTHTRGPPGSHPGLEALYATPQPNARKVWDELVCLCGFGGGWGSERGGGGLVQGRAGQGMAWQQASAFTPMLIRTNDLQAQLA
jgi:hypothetical protein